MTNIRAYQRAATKKYRRRLRAAALAYLGDECATCRFKDRRALQIDHIDGGGTKDRRAGASTDVVHRRVLAGDSRYQLLCANCNWIKRTERGEV